MWYDVNEEERTKRMKFFKITIYVERPEHVFIDLMSPNDLLWFGRLRRVPMLIGALAANEARMIRKTSGPSTSFPETISVSGLDNETNRKP